MRSCSVCKELRLVLGGHEELAFAAHYLAFNLRLREGSPNDLSSATRPTRACDCNLDAMAGFAAAHG
jgi:hypothetical protein